LLDDRFRHVRSTFVVDRSSAFSQPPGGSRVLDESASAEVRVQRFPLGAASWVDVSRGFLPDAGALLENLTRTVPWRQGELWRYDHAVIEPRMAGPVRVTDHPGLLATARWLRSRYRVDFMGPSAILYRDGRDALGAHRDRELRYTTDTLTAILSLGVRRPWVITRRGSSDARDLSPGRGDLFVLGGRAQADWLHGVPPVPGMAEARISLQWRWTSGTGPPEQGPGYRAPRHFSGGTSPDA
jgi:alkylated DNA repair dioxygenase AlkB